MKRLLKPLLWSVLSFSCVSLISAQSIDYVSSILWSGMKDVKVIGNYAYCSAINGLMILDISDPANLSIVGQCYCPGTGGILDVYGNYAYLAYTDSGLQVVDVSDPANPTISGNYPTSGFDIKDIFVSDNYLYAAGGVSGGLQIIDVSDPSAPTFAGIYDTPGDANAVFVSADYAYVADGSYGLQIINISNPAAPVFIEYYILNSVAAHDVFIVDNYAYVAFGDSCLQIIDVADPSNPSSAGNFIYSYSTNPSSLNVFVSGNYAFVCTERDYIFGSRVKFLEIIDITNVSDPILVYSNPDYPTGYNIFVLGDYAFITAEGELRIWDITNPSIPATVTNYGGFNIRNVFVSDNYVYASGRIIDISDPYQPEYTGHLGVGGNDIFVSENYAYVAGPSTSFQILDLSDPTNPILLGACELPHNLKSVSKKGNCAFVISSNGLHSIDVSDPSNPAVIGDCDLLGYPLDISISGNYACVVNYTNGLDIIDISDPENPNIAGNYQIPNPELSVALSSCVQEDYAYVYIDYCANEYSCDNRLLVLNISNPSYPTLAGQCIISDTPYTSYWLSIVVSGNYLFASDYYSGLQILDVSNPSNPTLADSYNTPGRPQDVFKACDNIFIADQNSLMILRSSYGNICGDVNDNTAVNILDIVSLINFLYHNGPDVNCEMQSDVNSDTAINILDITYLISYLYQGGPEPNCQNIKN